MPAVKTLVLAMMVTEIAIISAHGCQKKKPDISLSYFNTACVTGRWSRLASKFQLERFVDKNMTFSAQTTKDCIRDLVKSRRTSDVKRIISSRYKILSEPQLFSMQYLSFSLGYFEILNLLLSSNRHSQVLSPHYVVKASCRGRANTVATLLRNGAKISYDAASQTSEMLCAISKGYAATTLAILKLGNVTDSYLNQEDKFGNVTFRYALYYSRRSYNVLDKLLQMATVDVNVRFSSGQAPLTLSISSNAERRVVAMLLDRGAMINAADTALGSNTALHWACANRLDDVVDLLLSRGANIFETNLQGLYPIHTALLYGSSTKVLALLFQQGAFINEPMELDNNTLLIFAVSSKASLVVVRFLLSQGSDVNVQGRYGLTALHMAANKDMADVTRLLITNGADVNATNFRGRTALLYASDRGSYEPAKILLQAGASVNVQDADGITALLLASRFGFTEVAQLLFSYGAEVNTIENTGGSPLVYACEYQHVEMVSLLLRHGADVNVTNIYGETTLILAIDEVGSLEIVENLLRSGVNVNAISTANASALAFAVMYDAMDVVELLIHYGADVNIAVGDNTLLLQAAYWNKSVEMVRVLLQNGARIDRTEDETGMSILMLACRSNNVAVFRLLLENGANVDIRDVDNKTLLHYAAMYSSGELVSLILQIAGDQINCTDVDGNTPLLLLAQTSRADVLLMLLKRGANVNSANIEGDTALTFAASIGQTEMVRMLLESGANVDAKRFKDNRTALVSAITCGSYEVIEMLLKHGACVEDLYQNSTILMFAIEQNAPIEIVQLLVRFGADVNATDPDGRTALAIAKQTVNREIESWLARLGAREAFAVQYVPLSEKEQPLNNSYSLSTMKSAQPWANRNRRLALLVLFSGYYDESGRDPANSRQCIVALLKSLLDATNDRPDILAGYKLEIHYLDGEMLALHVPQYLDNFVAWKGFSQNGGDVTMSPVVFSPRIQCFPWNSFYESETQALRFQLQNYHMAQIYGEYCSQQISDANINQISPIFQSETVDSANETEAIMLMAIIGFAKGLNWKHFALMCLVNQYDTSILLEMPRFHRRLVTNGIEISAMLIAESFFDMFSEIRRQPRNRILFLANYRLNCSQCKDLFCSSNRAGLKPASYVILMLQSDCLKCYPKIAVSQHLEANCSLSVILIQMKMFYFGTTLLSMNKFPTFAFPPIITVFENIIKGTADRNLAIDETCQSGNWKAFNESLIATVYLVHSTEMKLQSQYQTSLTDLMSDRKNQSAIALLDRVVNEVAEETGYQNTKHGYRSVAQRTGVVVQANFNQKKMSAVSVKSSFEWRVVSKMWPKSGRSPDGQLESYETASAQSVLWATQDGLPPKDLSILSQLDGSYNEEAFLSTCVIAFALSILQILLVIRSFKGPSAQGDKSYFDRTSNGMLAIGCIFMNISAVTLLFGSEYFPAIFCLFRPLLIVSSSVFVNGLLFAKMFFIPNIEHENRYISRKYRKPNVFNADFWEQQRKENVSKLHRKAVKIALSLLATALLLQTIWFSSDPMRLKQSLEYEDDPQFDTASETYYVVQIEWCDSVSQPYWIAFFVTSQAVLLGVSIVMGLILKGKIRVVRQRFKADFFLLRMAISSSLTMMVFTSFLMIVVPSKPATIFHMKTLAFAVCELIFSASIVGILFFPIWSTAFRSSKQ